MTEADDSMLELAFCKRATHRRLLCIRLWWILPGVLVPLLGVHRAIGQPAPSPKTNPYAAATDADAGDAGAGDLPPAVRRIVVRRLVVDRFEGHVRSTIARAGVIDALEKERSVDLVSVKELEAEPQLIDGSSEGYVEAAQRLHVVAILRGFVQRDDWGYRAIITVIDGTNGRRRGKLEYAAKTLVELRTVLKDSLWTQLSPLLEQDHPPDTFHSAPQAPTATLREPESDSETLESPARVEEQRATPGQDRAGKFAAAAAERRPIVRQRAQHELPVAEHNPLAPEPARRALNAHCRLLELEARATVLRREFWYHDERQGALRAYTLRHGPSAGAAMSLFPLTLAGCRALSGLGLSLSYNHVLGVHSYLAGRVLPTRGSTQHAAVLFRIQNGWFSVTPSVGYAARHFLVDGGLLPESNYQSLRGGMEVRFNRGVFLAELCGAGLVVVKAGEIATSEWFPDTTAYGYESRAGLGVRPLEWLDLLLAVRAEVYRFDFHVGESLARHERRVAAGATDQYTQAELLLRFALP